LLYAMLAAGVAFTDCLSCAKRELEYKLSFAVFPLLFLLLPAVSWSRYRDLRDAFSFSCVLFALTASGIGLYRAVNSGDLSFLAYEKLSAPFHPTYMSVYQALALFHLSERWITGEYVAGRRGLHGLILAVLIAFLAMLASRAGILSAIGLWIFMVAGHRDSGRLRKALVLAAVQAVLLAAVSVMLPATQKRMTGLAVPPVNAPAADGAPRSAPARSSSALRMAAWRTSLEIIRENPMGLGTGNVQQELNARYLSKGEDYAAQRNLNAHNQYFQTAMELGWAGCALLTAILLAFTRMMYLRRMRFLALAGGLVLFHCLFESFLEVQAGIVFTCCWMLAGLLTERPGEVSVLRG
jgi:O-antigen ligase